MSESLNKFDKALVRRQISRAKNLDAELLRCRVGGDRHHGHRAKPYWEPSNKALPLAYQCEFCLTVKRMDVDPKYGFIIGRPSYEYRDGYKLKGVGEEAMSPQAVRAVVVLQSDEHAPPILNKE